MATLICSAHPDDEVIGCGGTIAKLAKKEDVIVLIFTYGGGSIFGLSDTITSWPPFMSEEELILKRIEESENADKVLGVKQTYFLGIRGNLPEKFSKEQKEIIMNLIKQFKIKKIFFHSIKDGHPDHLAVNSVMREIVQSLKNKIEIHTYQINLFDFSKKDPEIIMDVSKEYKKKFDALECFKSQRLWTLLLKPMILFKGIYFGKKVGVKFAEYFYRK